MIVVQEAWSSTQSPDILAALIGRARRGRVDDGETAMLLLPHAQDSQGATDAGLELLLKTVARATGTAIAGSAQVETRDGLCSVGYLIGADGKLLLRQIKILPDLVEGFTDSTSGLGRPNPFAVAKTQWGQIGMLIGEDILSPHHARALMLNGAEIILNPSREFADPGARLRLQARAARAYENHAYVITASPLTLEASGQGEKLPIVSGVWDEWGRGVDAQGGASFLRAELDIESLRRRRFEYFGNLCICLRPTVYAPGYKQAKTAAMPKSAEGWKEEGRKRAAARPPSPMPGTIDRYDVVLGQTLARNVQRPDELKEVVQANIDHAIETVRRYAAAPNTRLAVFPEFFLQGAGGGRSKEMWDHVGLTIDGWAIEKLGEFAQKFNIFVSGQMLESDPKWPGRIFNTAFILNDSGDVIHRYRKIQCADTFGAFPSTTPGSIMSRYLDLYGYEGLFPVCDTKLGRLATAVCFDMNFPELHRAFAVRGADLLLHPTAEPYNVRRAAWENMRQVRAYENCMYILSAALGGEFWDPHATLPTLNSRGHSKIVRFDGLVQAVADGPGTVMLSGQIDLKELRAARARIRSNLVLWDDPEVYGHIYASRVGIPDDLAAEPGINPYSGGKAMMEVIERYASDGIFVRPGSSDGARNAGDALLEVGLA